MIRPLFREWNYRLKLDRFTIRFWISVTRCLTMEIMPARLSELRARVDRLSPIATACDVAKLMQDFWNEADGIAAYEVLSNATHTGIVDYFEWMDDNTKNETTRS